MHVIDDFERDLVRRQRSPNTIRAYRWALDDLVRFLAAEGTSSGPPDRDQLERWQDSLIGRQLSPQSRSLAAVVVRRFLRYAAGHEGWDPQLEQAVAAVKRPRALPRPIAPADLELLKAHLAPRRPRMRLVELRNRALFFYLLTSGARVSEALQVTRDEAVRAVVWQKGGSQKVLRIPTTAARMIEDYLEARRDECPWLWVTHDDPALPRRLHPDGVREIWKVLARRLGMPAFTTHQLRHTCATEMLEAGIPELVVADHLGHASLATLRVYGEVRAQQREHMLDVLEQLAQSAPRPRLLPRIGRAGYRGSASRRSTPQRPS